MVLKQSVVSSMGKVLFWRKNKLHQQVEADVCGQSVRPVKLQRVLSMFQRQSLTFLDPQSDKSVASSRNSQHINTSHQ